MRGTEIVVSSEPQGHFAEGIIGAALKPGICCEITPATAMVGGRPTWRARTSADGAIGPVVILINDYLQGKLATDAYVSGTRGFLYWPVAGEEFNMLLGDVAGTGDTVTIGDLFGIEQNTGKLKRNSSYASAPFMAMETLAALTADALVWVKYLGNQA